MTWSNEDGLIVRYGTERSAVLKNGGQSTVAHKTLIHKFDFNDIAPTDVTVPNPNEAALPADSVITRATLYVTTGFVGPTGVLDIGLKVAAGTNTDDQGIDSAIAVTALDVVGDTIICDGDYIVDSDLTAKRLTAPQYIMTTWDTAAFTAGAATLVVEYLEL